MDQVSQIREKIDLVNFIAEFIPLKKMGRNFKANCPFHHEKTPSFVVSPERQIWHCFGCQKGGDCFTFLMEYEHLEFPEALRILAKKTGIALTLAQFDPTTSSQKEKLYILNALTAEFYHYVLLNLPAGKKALIYLDKRGVKPQTINTFKLGFSPTSGEALISYLINKKKYKREELIDAGLATYRRGKIEDFFINRIMFPLYDHRDNVIGFSGRVLDPTIKESKYINSRETLVYHKGDVFFGLNIAKNAIKKENNAIIMEGELDVIASFQEGISNVIAVKGTALTENQVNLISRYSEKVSLCFDQDSAGVEATKRSLPLLEKKGITTMVILTPNGKDPDESIKTNPLEFKKAVKEEIGVYDYLFNLALNSADKNKIEGKKRIADEILPVINGIENEIIKEHYLRKLSNEINSSYETILRQMEKVGKKEIHVVQKPQDINSKKDRREMLEEYLLSYVIQSEKAKEKLELTKKLLNNYEFKVKACQKIIGHLEIYFKNINDFDSVKFSRALPEELIPTFDVCFLFPISKTNDEKKDNEEIGKIIKELLVLDLKDKIRNLSDKIKEEKNESEAESLKKKLSELLSKIDHSKN